MRILEVNQIKSLRRIACWSILLLAVAPHVFAESKPDAPFRSPASIDIDFPGGSLAKFIALVAKDPNVSFNVIGTGDVKDFSVELPPFTLRNAEPATVANVLRQLLRPRNFSLEISGAGPNSITAVVWPMPPEPKPSQAETRFASFQLAPYLGDQSVDDIVGAIRAAWELDPANDREALRIKFHPGTAILLVSAPDRGINLTRDIIANLQRSSGKSTQTPPIAPDHAK